MLGGLGICGKPFCCSTYMDDFVPVSIKMAKTQNLSLNPTKISGTCGRLMCCLNYEQCTYEETLKQLPKQDSFVLTPDGPGNVTDVNVLKETVSVKLDDHAEMPKCYHNCEVCVLRSGKGSRDGIAIPDKRPERYVPPREDEIPEEQTVMLRQENEAEEQESREEENRSGRRRRNRGQRRGKDAEGKARAQSAVPSEQKETRGEEKNGGEKKEKKNHGYRGRRRGNRNTKRDEA